MHTSCGAVKAACDVVTKNATYLRAGSARSSPSERAMIATPWGNDRYLAQSSRSPDETCRVRSGLDPTIRMANPHRRS